MRSAGHLLMLMVWATRGSPAAAAIKLDAKLNPDPPEVGETALNLSFRTDKGDPAEVSGIDVKVFMPAMASMPRMDEQSVVNQTSQGHYQAKFKLPMAGTWSVVIAATAEARPMTYTGSLTTGVSGLLLRGGDIATSAGGSAPLLAIGPERLQLLGVRFAEAKVMPLTREVRAAGLVEADKTRRSELTLRYGGYVEKQLRGRVGDLVKAGTPLMTVYSPDLLAAEQEFLLAHGNMGTGGGAALHASTAERLRNFGLAAADLERIKKSGVPARTVTITAPQTGTILDINVREGSSFSANQPLYTIGDLSKTYIVARVFQRDLADLKVGQEVSILSPETGGQSVAGRVDLVFPDVSEGTGTGNVRVVATTPVLGQRPGLFVDLRFPLSLGERLAVPSTAILYAGKHQYVFIDRGGGHLEPREVFTGRNTDEWTEIGRGLRAGERVVASGTFLLSSEAQLRSALPKWVSP